MINDIIFQGEQSIKWDYVRTYIKKQRKMGGRYDSRFTLPIYGKLEEVRRHNVILASIQIRHDANGNCESRLWAYFAIT